MSGLLTALQSSIAYYVGQPNNQPKEPKSKRRPAPINTESNNQNANQSVNQSVNSAMSQSMLDLPITPPLSSSYSDSFFPCEYAKFGCTALIDTSLNQSIEQSIHLHNQSDWASHCELVKSAYRLESQKLAHARAALTQAQSRSRKSENIIRTLNQTINHSNTQVGLLKGEIDRLNQAVTQSNKQAEERALHDATVESMMDQLRSKDDYIAQLEAQMNALLSINQSLALAHSNTTRSQAAAQSTSATSGPEGLPHVFKPFPRRTSDFAMSRKKPLNSSIKPRSVTPSPQMHTINQSVNPAANRATITTVLLAGGNVIRHGPSPQMVGVVGNLTLNEHGLDLSTHQSTTPSSAQSTDQSSEDETEPGQVSTLPRPNPHQWRRPQKEFGEQSVGASLGLQYACPVILVKKAVGVIAPENGDENEMENYPL